MDRATNNRRKDERLRLSNPVIARLGSVGVVLIDVSQRGARIEHYSRFDRGAHRTLRINLNGEPVAVVCRIVSCRVARFTPGDEGLTVYESGLVFENQTDASVDKLKEVIAAYLAGSLVEQVANAKGFVAPTRGEMPIFRAGMLSSNRLSIVETRQDKHLIPEKEIVRNVGFVRFSLVRGRWVKKWTMSSVQPSEGFTVSASEPQQQVDDLCWQYVHADRPTRHLIRLLAELSVEAAVASEPFDLRERRAAQL